MRSKEVEKAIKQAEYITTCAMLGESLCPDYIEILLSYIEELEKMIPTPSNEVPVEYQTDIWVNKRDAVMKSEIRDKIKELELEEDRIYKLDHELEREKAIDVVISKRVLLESLLGE